MVQKYKHNATPLFDCIVDPLTTLTQCDRKSIPFQQDLLADSRLAQTMNGLQAEFYKAVPNLERDFKIEIVKAKCHDLGSTSPLNPGTDGDTLESLDKDGTS